MFNSSFRSELEVELRKNPNVRSKFFSYLYQEGIVEEHELCKCLALCGSFAQKYGYDRCRIPVDWVKKYSELKSKSFYYILDQLKTLVEIHNLTYKDEDSEKNWRHYWGVTDITNQIKMPPDFMDAQIIIRERMYSPKWDMAFLIGFDCMKNDPLFDGEGLLTIEERFLNHPIGYGEGYAPLISLGVDGEFYDLEIPIHIYCEHKDCEFAWLHGCVNVMFKHDIQEDRKNILLSYVKSKIDGVHFHPLEIKFNIPESADENRITYYYVIKGTEESVHDKVATLAKEAINEVIGCVIDLKIAYTL